MPPTLAVCNEDSLGDVFRGSFPRSKVVKALNTVNCNVMVDPSVVPGEHDVFMCGNDEGAKDEVRELLGDSASRPSGSTTSATSLRRAARRCTCHSGSASWAWPEGANFNIRVVS